MKLVTEIAGVQLHVPVGPTFQAIKCRRTGDLRSSTVNLSMGKDEITWMKRIDSYSAFELDHYPVRFELNTKIERAHKPRRISKTLL